MLELKKTSISREKKFQPQGGAFPSKKVKTFNLQKQMST